jgi:4-coumarate--CoA ligase
MAKIGLSQSRLVLIEGPAESGDGVLPTIEKLMHMHEQHASYVEHTFKPGEAKTAVAFLCFSSGTTGNPKVRVQFAANV